MQTGYYVGNGSSLTISGLGFQPDLLIIKADTTAGVGAVWKSSAMPAGETAFFSTATVDDTSGMITFTSDGFTLTSNVDVNTANVRYTYIAFQGSNCTSTGTFCVGSYSGNGTTGHSINTGFQPDLVWIKKASTTAETGVWRSSTMSTNYTNFFAATAISTSSNTLIQTLSTTGFTLGTNIDVNTNNNTYWFAAFKAVSGVMAVGSYTGNAATTSITGVGFSPSMMFYKSSAAATGGAGYNIEQSEGNYSSLFTDTANTINEIESLDSNGFTVGTAVGVNGSGATIYWVAFGGAPSAAGSGSFVEADGSYTGNGTSQSITGLGFSPNLVVIGTSGQDSAFRTSEMKGDDTAVFGGATADFTGGISSLDANGFTLGASLVTNTSGSVYYWTAFGNAYNPETHTGSADFEIGAYTGNGAVKTVLNIPFTPDIVLDKSESTQASNWTSSAMPAGTTQFLGAVAQNTAGAEFSSLNTNGFTLGTNSNANKAGTLYNWFAFKNDGNFISGNYTGNGTGQTITGFGFQPDLIWVKRTTAVAGSFTMSSVSPGTSLVYGGAANSTVDVTNLTSDGFTIGTGAEANTNAGSYWYAAWQGKTYDQTAYRLFYNQNSALVSSPLAAQNTTVTLSSIHPNFRIRLLLQAQNDTLYPNGQNFKLQFATSTLCSSATYVDITTSTAIAYYDNPTPADGSALTATSTDPVNGADTIDNQTYDESNPFTNSQSAIANSEDGKWDFSLVDNNAPTSTAYCFRAVFATGTVLGTYGAYPGIVTPSTGTNSPPSISNIELNGGSDIILTPNTTTLISVTASTTDPDGSGDIAYATGTIYRTSLGHSCSIDNQDCYQIASSSCSFSGSTSTVTCSANLWYFAQPTGAYTNFSTDTWSGAVTVVDSVGHAVTVSSGAVNVDTLAAINVTTSSINYGTVGQGADTGSTNQLTTIQNVGNTSTTLQVDGTALKFGANTLATSSQHYATTTFTFGGSERMLSDTATTVSGFTLAAPTSTTAVQGNLYWGLGVSGGAVSGNYSGGITFLASAIGTAPNIAFVQATSTDAGVLESSMTETFDSPVTAGDLLVVATYDSSQDIIATDTFGTVFSKLGLTAANLNNSYHIYIGTAANSGVDNITVHITNSGGIVGESIYEYGGVSETVDASSTAAANSGTSVAAGSITTTDANDLIFAFFTNANNHADQWTALNPNFTLRQSALNAGGFCGGSGDCILGADWITTSTVTTNASTTISASDNWTAAAVAFERVAAGSTISYATSSGATAGGGSYSSITFPLDTTSAGSNTVLYVAATEYGSGSDPTSVTFNGNPLTLVTSTIYFDTGGRFSVWQMINPSSTNANVVISRTGMTEYSVTAVVYSGVNQGAPYNGIQLQSVGGGVGSSVTVAPSSTVGDLVVGFCGYNPDLTSFFGVGRLNKYTDGHDGTVVVDTNALTGSTPLTCQSVFTGVSLLGLDLKPN